MSAGRVRQRQRILRARTISERIAKAEQRLASNAEREAVNLAARLMREIALTSVGASQTTGQMMAARGALIDRLHAALGSTEERQRRLSSVSALAAARAASARQARRSAETWTDQAVQAAERAEERRLAIPFRQIRGRA